jgi:hypothetical protein
MSDMLVTTYNKLTDGTVLNFKAALPKESQTAETESKI